MQRQRELLAALREVGAEIVLDTEAAELAAPAKFAGQARHAPWALPSIEGLLGPDHFKRNAPSDVIGQIARFAVQSGVDAVLAPAHFLGDPTCGDWLAVDRESSLLLRAALDREGGSNIAIDYPVIIPHTELNQSNTRGQLVAALHDLPIDNIWVRASGLDANSGPLTVKRYLTAISYFHNLGKPIIADCLGGLVGTAALAFGVVSALSHGINERERFDTSAWYKPPSEHTDDTRFRRAIRIKIPSLDRSATIGELEFLAKAKGGRRLVGCSDRNCCPQGLSDMIADPRRHAAQQTFRGIAELQAVPDSKREHHFLNGPMADADRRARQIKSLRPPVADVPEHRVNATKLMKNLSDYSQKIEQLQNALFDLHETRGDETPRSRPTSIRNARPNAIKEDRL